MYNSLRTGSPRTAPRDKWNPLTTKTSRSEINWRDTYFFDHQNAKSSNFPVGNVSRVLEGMGAFEMPDGGCELNG